MPTPGAWIGRRLVFEARAPSERTGDRPWAAVIYSAAPGRWFVHYRGTDVVDSVRAVVVLVVRERPAEVWLPASTTEWVRETRSTATATRVVRLLDAACEAVDAELLCATPLDT